MRVALALLLVACGGPLEIDAEWICQDAACAYGFPLSSSEIVVADGVATFGGVSLPVEEGDCISVAGETFTDGSRVHPFDICIEGERASASVDYFVPERRMPSVLAGPLAWEMRGTLR